MVLVNEAWRAGGSVVLDQSDRDDPMAPDPPAPRLSKFSAPEIVFGAGSMTEAAHAAVRLGARRPFVVTDPGVSEPAGPRS